MKRIVLFLIMLLVACATTPRAQIDLAYSTVNAYVDSTEQALARGRITKEQALRAADNADKALGAISKARKALAGCTAVPCADFTSIMQGLQPNLLALEKELREREGATK